MLTPENSNLHTSNCSRSMHWVHNILLNIIVVRSQGTGDQKITVREGAMQAEYMHCKLQCNEESPQENDRKALWASFDGTNAAFRARTTGAWSTQSFLDAGWICYTQNGVQELACWYGYNDWQDLLYSHLDCAMSFRCFVVLRFYLAL